MRWVSAVYGREPPTVISCPGTWTFIPHRPVGKHYSQICRKWGLTAHTRNQVHGYKHSTQRRQLRKNVIDLIVRVSHFDGNLGQVVRVWARENFFVVIQVLGHRNQMVLWQINIKFSSPGTITIPVYRTDIVPLPIIVRIQQLRDARRNSRYRTWEPLSSSRYISWQAL